MGKTTKGDIIAATSNQLDLPLSESYQIVDTILNSMIDTLSREESIDPRWFGTFHLNQYGSYRGRNPQNGSVVSVKPQQLPVLRVGNSLGMQRILGARSN